MRPQGSPGVELLLLLGVFEAPGLGHQLPDVEDCYEVGRAEEPENALLLQRTVHQRLSDKVQDEDG